MRKYIKRQLPIYHEGHVIEDDYCFSCECKMEGEEIYPTLDIAPNWAKRWQAFREMNHALWQNRREET